MFLRYRAKAEHGGGHHSLKRKAAKRLKRKKQKPVVDRAITGRGYRSTRVGDDGQSLDRKGQQLGTRQADAERSVRRGQRELQGRMRRQAGQGGRLGHAGKPPSDARDGGGRRYRHGSGGGTDPRPRERDRLLPCFPAALLSDRTAAAGRAPQLKTQAAHQVGRAACCMIKSSFLI